MQLGVLQVLQSCMPADNLRIATTKRSIYVRSAWPLSTSVLPAAPEQWLEFSSPVYEQLYQKHFARAYQSTDFYICIVNLFFGLSWVVRVWRINPW